MNVNVAIIDLKENLLIPLIPWPLVHPAATLVPTPTNKPATDNKKNEFEIEILISWDVKNLYRIGLIINPTINKKLSNLLSLEVKKLLAIPLIPINRPLKKKNRTTDNPINVPPRNAGTGVKLTIFI